MDLTPEYIELKKSIEKQRKVIAQKEALTNKQRVILKSMLEHCTHEELERKDEYFEGSYYDKASTTSYMQCKLCGERGPKTVEMHSYYG